MIHVNGTQIFANLDFREVCRYKLCRFWIAYLTHLAGGALMHTYYLLTLLYTHKIYPNILPWNCTSVRLNNLDFLTALICSKYLTLFISRTSVFDDGKCFLFSSAIDLRMAHLTPSLSKKNRRSVLKYSNCITKLAILY